MTYLYELGQEVPRDNAGPGTVIDRKSTPRLGLRYLVRWPEGGRTTWINEAVLTKALRPKKGAKMTLRQTEPTATMAAAIEDITVRHAACKVRYDDYDPKCNRRSTTDALYEVRRNRDAVERWLRGDNDTPVVWLAAASTQEGRDAYRIHYAAEALVVALRDILIAEYYAGIRTMAEVEPLDPFRYVDGERQAAAERLRLSEGIVWTFPRSVLS